MAINREQITEHDLPEAPAPRPPTGPRPVLGADGGYKAGLCGDACTYDPAEAKKLIKEGGGLPGGQIDDLVQRRHRLAQGVGRRRLQQHQQRAGQRQGVRRQPGRHLRRLPQPDRPASKMTGPFRAGWQMDYPLIQNFLQPLYYTDASSNDGQCSNADVRQAGQPGQRRVRHGRRRCRLPAGRGGRHATRWPPSRSGTRTAAPATRTGSRNVALNPFSVPVYNEIKVK